MATKIQIRRDTLSNWNFYNPILSNGEIAFVTDQNRLKVGNGSSTFTALPYIEADAYIDSVILGTDTTGNYVETLISGDGIDLIGQGTESASVQITNSGVLSLVGTENEIDVSASTGNIILGLPSTINANTTGNAATATKLANSRAIALIGDLSGSASFDGSASVSINAIIQPDSVALGTDTIGSYVTQVTGSGAGISVTGSGESASVVVANTGVTSLTGTASQVSVSSSAGSVTLSLPSTINVNTSGNAGTATTLQNSRTIELTGDVTGSASFNGGANASIAATIAPNSVALGTDTTGNYVATVGGTDGVSISGSGSETAAVTIANTDKGSSQNIFKNVAVSGQSDIVADSNNDTLTFAGGTGINLTTNATTDTLTVTNSGVTALTGTTNEVEVSASTGSVTLSLPNTINANTTGSAATLTNSRVIALSGDVSGSVTFDGSANVDITTTVQPNSIALGTDTTGNYVATASAGTGISVSGSGSENSNITISNTGVTSLAGTASQISVSASNGDATLSLPSAVTFPGTVTLNADPTQALHAVTKQYVDEVAEGLRIKPAVEISTTASLDATYNNGTNGVGATLTANSNGAFPQIDGVTLASIVSGFNGVLVKNQSNPAHNGRYNLTQIGNGSNPWILTRCGLCDESDEIAGMYIFVKDGNLGKGTGWVAIVNNPATFVIGNDAINFIQFSGAGTYTAGIGLALNGTEFSNIGVLSLAGTSNEIDVSASSGNIVVSLPTTINANTTGSAATLTNSRTIELTGDVTGSASFNGGANASIAATIAPNSVALGTDTTGNYVATIAGTSNQISVSGSGSENSAVTLSLPATINVDTSGNAATATKLANSRTIALGGDLSGSASFDGSASVSISATIQPDSVALGTDTTGNYVTQVTGSGAGISVTGSGESASVVVSNTGVTSLTGTASQVSVSSSAGSVTLSLPSTINVNTSGNAATATTLQNSRTIALLGDVSGSVSFDGSASAGIAATLANSGVSAGTYRSVTVNAKGLVTGGTNPTTLSGYGITDALSNSSTSTQSGYFGDIFLYDDSTPSHYLGITNSANLTAARTLSLNVNDANRTVSLSGDLTVSSAATISGTNTGDQTITLTGDVTGTGTGTFLTTLANTAVTPASYGSASAVGTFTVDSKGRLTAASNTTIAIAQSAVTNLITDLNAKAPLASPTFTGTVTVPSPTNSTDAATKQYVDNIAEGLQIKESVATATTASVDLSSPPAEIDGVALTNNMRVLVKNQSNTSQNGIYVYSTSTEQLTRSLDFDTAQEIKGGDFVFVEGGNTQGGNGWVQTENVQTIGTDPILFTQFSRSGGDYTAGTGLELNGTVFSNIGVISLQGTENQISVSASTGSISISIPSTFIFPGTVTLNSDPTQLLHAATKKYVDSVRIKTETSSYTATLLDAGKTIEMNSASANTFTIPLNSSVEFLIGTTIDVVQYGIGKTTIVAENGVTIRSKDGSLALTDQYSAATLYKRDTNEWVAIGDLSEC